MREQMWDGMLAMIRHGYIFPYHASAVAINAINNSSPHLAADVDVIRTFNKKFPSYFDTISGIDGREHFCPTPNARTAARVVNEGLIWRFQQGVDYNKSHWLYKKMFEAGVVPVGMGDALCANSHPDFQKYHSLFVGAKMGWEPVRDFYVRDIDQIRGSSMSDKVFLNNLFTSWF